MRQRFVDAGLCRNEVNRRVRILKAIFDWGIEERLVPSSEDVLSLGKVKALAKGRTPARESKKIRPIDDVSINAVEPHVSRQVWAMIELQRLTAMRPGEVCIVRTCDLDMSGDDWSYEPSVYKTEHLHDEDEVRRVAIGPRAKSILKQWLRADRESYLFSPREAEAERRAQQRAARKTRVQPSQQGRRGRKSKPRVFNDHYTRLAYATAIARACDQAFPHPTLADIPEGKLDDQQRAELKAWRKAHRWAPNRLRKAAATRIEREFGEDAAKAACGHSNVSTTRKHYIAEDRTLAVRVMRDIG